MTTRDRNRREKASATPPAEGSSGKKPYRTPELVSYGDIREVTRDVSGTMALDVGGHGNMDRTS